MRRVHWTTRGAAERLQPECRIRRRSSISFGRQGDGSVSPFLQLQDWSVEAWVNVPSPSTGEGYIYSVGGAVGQSLGVLDGKPVVELTLCPSGGVQLVGPIHVDDGQWHHVVGLKAGGDVRLYVDTLLVASTTVSGSMCYQKTGGPWPSIGRTYFFGDGSNQFAGAIDEVAIYPTPLSLSSIRTHYTASGRALSPSRLLRKWRRVSMSRS